MLLWLPVCLSSIFSITLICVLPSICLFHSWTSTITYLYLWSSLIFWLTSTYSFACLLIICLSLAMRPRLVVLKYLIVKWKSLKSHPQNVRKCYLCFFFLIMACMSWVLIHKCIFHPEYTGNFTRTAQRELELSLDSQYSVVSEDGEKANFITNGFPLHESWEKQPKTHSPQDAWPWR